MFFFYFKELWDFLEITSDKLHLPLGFQSINWNDGMISNYKATFEIKSKVSTPNFLCSQLFCDHWQICRILTLNFEWVVFYPNCACNSIFIASLFRKSQKRENITGYLTKFDGILCKRNHLDGFIFLEIIFVRSNWKASWEIFIESEASTL